MPLREIVHTVLHGATRKEADELSRSLNSKGIGVQVFNIAKKIAKVDEVMTTHNKNTVARIREIHPEVCFWSLTGQAMKTNKKPVSGSCERLTALRTVEKQTDDIYQKACSQWRRYEVARDDILDALVAAVTAKLSYTDAYTLQSIPAVPQWDEEKCLRMEMVYAEKVTS